MVLSKDLKKMILLANLTALAIVLGIFERYLDIVPVPGAKIGLANLVILIILYLFSYKEAMVVNIVRVFLTGMLSGAFGVTMVVGLTGAILSLTSMAILKKLGFGIILVSLLGSITHQIGQIIALVFILDTESIIYYGYIMLPLGVLAGILIGIITNNFLKHYGDTIEEKYNSKNKAKNNIMVENDNDSNNA